MKYSTTILIAIMFTYGCNTAIKNNDAQIVIEEGTTSDSNIAAEISGTVLNDEILTATIDTTTQTYWVGFFNPHKEVDLHDKYIAADEGLTLFLHCQDSFQPGMPSQGTCVQRNVLAVLLEYFANALL